MTVTVKLFGPQATLAGTHDVRVQVGDGATVAAVRDALAKAVPALGDSLAGSRLAVDHEYVDDAAPILADQEIALIGMVSGG